MHFLFLRIIDFSIFLVFLLFRLVVLIDFIDFINRIMTILCLSTRFQVFVTTWETFKFLGHFFFVTIPKRLFILIAFRRLWQPRILMLLVLEKRSSAVVEIKECEILIVVRFQSLVADILHVGGNLPQHGVREGGHVSQVVQQELQHETLPASEDEAAQLTAMNFPEEQHLGEDRERDSQESEDEPKDRDDQEEHPPEPEGEEVLLVEDVVAEDAEEVLLVDVAVLASLDDATAHFCGEDLTHGVVELEASVLVHVEVSDHLPAVAPELRVEDPVCDLDTG